MKIIIVGSGLPKLLSFLKKNHSYPLENSRYLLFTASLECEALFQQFGISPVRQVDSPTDLDEFIKEYIKIIDSVAQKNPGMFWWSTFLGTKNICGSPLARILPAFVQFLNLEKGIDPGGFLFLVEPPHTLIPTIESFCRKKRQKVVCLGLARNSVIFHRVKFWYEIAKEVLSTLLIIHNLRRLGYGPNKKVCTKKIHLVKSFAYSSSFQNEFYNDPFFGFLPEFIKQHTEEDETVMVLAQSFVNHIECYKKMKTVKNLKIRPYQADLTYWDVLTAFCSFLHSYLKKPIQCKENFKFYGKDISPLIKEIVDYRRYGFTFSQFLSHRIGLSLTKYYKLASIIMTFEGNPWERMLIRGLRDGDPEVTVIGYQHTVIPQAWLAYFPGVYESTVGCLPDVVLTTGQKPYNILKRYGNFNNIELRTCCALRYDYLHKLNPFARKTKQNKIKIVVALDGLMEVRSLVQYVLKQASQMDTNEFILRNHPSNTSKSFLNYTREITNLVDNIQLSQGTSVEEDISKCDLVLYWGTAIALEAIMLGKPVVHFDRGDLLSHDSLFELDVFKWTVTPTQDLSSIVAEIQELSDDEYKNAQIESRSYVKDYFKPVNEDAMSLFLPRDISYQKKSLNLDAKL